MKANLNLLSLIAAGPLKFSSARFLGGFGSSFLANNGEVSDDSNAPAQLDDEEPPLLDDISSSQHDSLIAAQFTDDPYAHRDHMEMIQTGELGLVAIRYKPTSFVHADNGNYYTDVLGEFCVFDPKLNKGDPSKYSTIKDILSESTHCGEHRYTIPLQEVMQVVRDYDSSRLSGNGGEMQTLPVSGLLLHEGYAGAGLISNALATFDSTHVVSEHSAIRDALSACDVIRNRYKLDDCSSTKQQQLVQDVISLLSRTSDASIKHLYLKLPSTSSAYLPTLRTLYPDAKWVFTYRSAEEALAKATQRKRNKTCMKARNNPSSALAVKSNEIHVDLAQLSHHEICALHLTSLLDTAIKEHDESGTGMLISYDDMLSGNVDAIVDIILPYLGLKEDIDSDPLTAKGRISEVLSMRSNSRGKRGKQWDTAKEGSVEITEEVRAAAKDFMN